ncbi:MAG: hypothetical protein LBV29_09230, partial [Azoarcus sp.]|nr:hypothetical protein [Azoarcus sp.]
FLPLNQLGRKKHALSCKFANMGAPYGDNRNLVAGCVDRHDRVGKPGKSSYCHRSVEGFCAVNQ